MQDKQPRLGSITLLFTVVVLCVAALSALAMVTAHADLAVAEKYAAQATASYEAESAGQEWLAQVHAAIQKKGETLRQTDLPEGTLLDEKQITAELRTAGGRILAITLELAPDTAAGYRILRWENTAQWTQNMDIGTLWDGSMPA